MRCWVIEFTFVSHSPLGTGWQNLILHYVMLHKTGSRELWTVIHTYSICGCTLRDNEKKKGSCYLQVLDQDYTATMVCGRIIGHPLGAGVSRWCVNKLQCRLHLVSMGIHHTEDRVWLWQGYDCWHQSKYLIDQEYICWVPLCIYYNLYIWPWKLQFPSLLLRLQTSFLCY